MIYAYLKQKLGHGIAVPASIWRNPWHFLAFGCGCGAMPIAPGTWVTLLLGVPIYLLLSSLSLVNYVLVVVCLAIGAIILSHYVARAIKVHDHPGMCVDEIIGYLVTMIGAPAGNYLWLGCGVVFFRLFDIWKPQPIRFIDQHLGGGLGVVLDDILAGVYSIIALRVLMLGLASCGW